ncbi:MAG: hypothetical protein V1708_03060 [Candidatus Micrarchaeota archaeon]
MLILKNPEEIVISSNANEVEFKRAVELQIGIWLKENGIHGISIHSFFFNKAAYYIAEELTKPVSRGWYLYGPYLRNYPEEFQDENKVCEILQEYTNIDVKFNKRLVSERSQKVISELMKQYLSKKTNNPSLYGFLKFIYQEKSGNFNIAQKFYLAKLECLNTLFNNQTNDLNRLNKVLVDYQKEILRPAYSEAVGLKENEQRLVVDFCDLIYDAIETRQPPQMIEEAKHFFAKEVNRIPCLRNNIASGKSKDAASEKQYRATFLRLLSENVIPEVKSELSSLSRRVYA